RTGSRAGASSHASPSRLPPLPTRPHRPQQGQGATSPVGGDWAHELASARSVCDAGPRPPEVPRSMATVLITGCSSGFGLLTALAFARRDHRVVATMRDPARDEELARTVRTERLPVTILPLDVCDPAQVTTTVARAETDHGPLDVLVNNSGIELRSSIEDADEADVRRQFETNVFGTVRMIQAVLPRMRERRAGTIVNLSSIAGLV